MHPLIAQCLRRRVRPESRVAPMLHTIQQTLERWMKRCHSQNDEIRILYHTVQGCWHGGTAADFLTVYERYKFNSTVSVELLRTFCYFAGESLIYQQEYALAETLLKESLRDDDTVTLADSVETVGCGTFYGCSALTDVTMAYGIHVNKDAFYGTPWLEGRKRLRRPPEHPAAL